MRRIAFLKCCERIVNMFGDKEEYFTDYGLLETSDESTSDEDTFDEDTSDESISDEDSFDEDVLE